MIRDKKGYSMNDLKAIVESKGVKLINETVLLNKHGNVGYNEKFTIEYSEGYKSITSISKITRNNPFIFSKSNPYTIENINLWLTKNAAKYKLISEVFEGARCPLEWSIEGSLPNFKMSWNQFQRGQRHPLLRTERIKNKLKLNKNDAFSEAQEILNKKKTIWMVIEEQDYINVKTPLYLINKNGYLSKMSIDHLREGKSPTYFGNDKDFSEFNLYKFVEDNTNCAIKKGQKYHGTNAKYTLVCKIHGEFKKTIREVLGSGGEFCCPSCGTLMRSGTSHYKYNPNTISDRQGLNYNKWRKSVLEKDDFTCLSCKARGGKLQAHHKDGWNWCEEKRFDVDNGATLCHACHFEFHSIYGMGNNTNYQFNEFLGGDTFHEV